MTTPRWWAEYKCPKCGYASIVTDLCRSCQRVMFATGFEEWSEVLTVKGQKKLKIHRKRMTKESETYSHAVLTSHFAEQQCEEMKIKIPDWAWFG